MITETLDLTIVTPIKMGEKEKLEDDSVDDANSKLTAETLFSYTDIPIPRSNDIAELIKEEKIKERIRYKRVKEALQKLKDRCKEFENELDCQSSTISIDQVLLNCNNEPLGRQSILPGKKRKSDVLNKKISRKPIREPIEPKKNTRIGICAPCYII